MQRLDCSKVKLSHSGMSMESDVIASCLVSRATVLAAVTRNGTALQWMGECWIGDAEIVLAAVKQDWHALQWAAESCKIDR
eukprot:265649-Amphidinium_carterae.1